MVCESAEGEIAIAMASIIGWISRLAGLVVFCHIVACANSGRQETEQYPPAGFVYVQEALPYIICDIRYYGDRNFTGRPVPGYLKPAALITEQAAEALRGVQRHVDSMGYRLKVFDAYRPQRAVDSFVKWAEDLDDTLQKKEYYPEVDKVDLFKLGYIAARSGHTRGSTVDLTLVDKHTAEEMDMGSAFDFFGEISHHDAADISAHQRANRQLLKEAMARYGFKSYAEEWWHYTLIDEPYPDTYFDFVVRERDVSLSHCR